ncbi:MAG: pitrilysin family protein [Candidatus Paceibacterota bacterium]
MKANKKILTNGVRLITVPMKDNPAVTVMVMTEAGSKYETDANNGIAHFLEHMCFKGGKTYATPRAVSTALDRLGAESNAMTGHEYTGYYAKAHPKHFKKIVDVIADVFVHARLDETELNRERGVILEEINMYEDFPPRHVADLLYRLVYSGQPAGQPILGSRENIKQMTREQFLEFHHTHYVADATVVFVAGAFDTKEVTREVERAFAELPASKAVKMPKTVESQKKPQLLIEQKKTDQTHVALGIRAYKASDKRAPALNVLKTVLGGGMSSRLFLKLREEMGVCYYVKSSLDLHRDHGLLGVSAGVDTNRLEEVVGEITREFARLKREPVDEKELKKAKDYLIGSLALSLETSDSVNDFFAEQELLERGELKTPNRVIKEIRAVSAADIQTVARDIFTNERLNMAVVGKVRDEAGIRRALRIEAA